MENIDIKWAPIGENGVLMTMEEFAIDCSREALIDTDGYGYYATKDKKSDVIVVPSDIENDLLKVEYSHVLWFTGGVLDV